MTAYRPLRLLIAALLFIGATRVHAWGDKGHEVIALIAWHYLSPAKRDAVGTLLQRDNREPTAAGFADAATWADAYRDADRNGDKLRYEQTRRWHYINLNVGNANLKLGNADIARACYGSPPPTPQQRAADGPAKACIVDKIEQFARALNSQQTAADERVLALKFLIHLLGDLHQPLHVSDNNDSGGNEVRVTARGLKRGTLHGYWDNGVVRPLGRKPEAIARRLIAQTDQSQIRAWRRGTPREWALETFAVARDTAYGELPPPDAAGAHALDESYTAAAKIAAAHQLMQAGVRLAWLLERQKGLR